MLRRWNIRVELSRAVYRELHQIGSLSHVHIRLQEGPSQYETSLSSAYNASSSALSLGAPHAAPLSPLFPPGFDPSQLPPTLGGFYAVPSSTHAAPIPKPPSAKSPRKTPLSRDPPTLSGFKELKSLAVLDIDSLDILSELKSCIRTSAGTLSKLKLSFSEKLASLARTPSINADAEESDPEDGFQPPPPPPAQNDDASEPARAFRAQEEKERQESALGRIFGTEPFLDVKSRKARETDKGKEIEKRRRPPVKSDKEFVVQMTTYMLNLMGKVNGTADLAASPDVVGMIGRAAQKYLDEARLPKGSEQEPSSDPDSSPSGVSQSPEHTVAEASAETSEPAASLRSPSATSGKAKTANKDASPDDIDIEEPEAEFSLDPQDSTTGEASVTEPTTAPPRSSSSIADRVAHAEAEYWKVLADLVAHKLGYNELSNRLEELEVYANQLEREIQRLRDHSSAADLKRLLEAESQMLSFADSIDNMQREISTIEGVIKHAEGITPASTDANVIHAHIQRMSEYLVKTRGIALQSLSIYLIPVKASVLSRAVDLRVLRQLTLLNVGIQNPVWALLHKENREAPLPLRKIFTDNVTPIFLNFVSGLAELHELFMLERENGYKPKSFAPRTEVTIDLIRKMVLRRHLPTLRRLMIKNLADTTWDVNEKTVLLLCRQGRRLEELACSISGVPAMVRSSLPFSTADLGQTCANANPRTQHIFMQQIAGLASLRALHIVQLRSEDTCQWVLRETKQFLVDNLSHYPSLKLEWILIGGDAEADRLVWIAPDEDRKRKEKKHGEDTATAEDVAAEADLAGETTESENEDEDEDYGDEDGDEAGSQKIKIIEAVPFCEVEGVRIFKREVVEGKL